MKQSDASLHKMPSYHGYLSKFGSILDICSCKCKCVPCKRKCPDDCHEIRTYVKWIYLFYLSREVQERGPRALIN